MPSPCATRCRSIHAESGLTLIELCIAVALLAIIATMSYRGLDSMNRTSERTLAEGDRWQSVALFFERFASDVAQPSRRPVREGMDTGATPSPDNPATPTLPAAPTTSTTPTTPTANKSKITAPLAAWWGRLLPDSNATEANNRPDADTKSSNFDAQLEFTRKSATGRNEVRLGYRLRESRVELLVWHVLDRAPGSKPEIFTVLEGVKSLRFLHLDAAGAWQDTWPVSGNNDPLPRAVQVDLMLNDGTKLNRIFAL